MPNTVQIIFQVDPNNTGQNAIININNQIANMGQTGQQAGGQVAGGLSAAGLAGGAAAIGITLAVEALRRGVAEAYEFGKAAVAAFNQANDAALGLQTIAKSVGVNPDTVLEAVKNLDLVKNGLLTVDQASTVLKNNLRTGFNLEESINLLKGFGDIAAFNKQSAISFGDAVVRTSEGIRQNIANLADAGGLTTNPAAIQKRAGIEFDELKDKTNGAANATKYYKELLKELAPFQGDAAKKAETFAGGQDKLAAAQQKVLVTVGELIAKNPELNKSFAELAASLETVNIILKDENSNLSRFVTNATTGFSYLVSGAAQFLESLEGILGLLRDFENISTLGASEGFFGALFPQDDELTKKVKEQAKKISKAVSDALREKPPTTDDASGAKLGKKDQEELEKAVLKFQKESEEKYKKFQQSVREAADAVTDLQSKLTNNPIANAFETAEKRQREFLEKFKEVPAAMIEEFKKANNELLRLEIFKGKIDSSGRVGNLQAEIAKLNAGLGGSALRSESGNESLTLEQRKLDLLKQGIDLRNTTSLRELEVQAIIKELEQKRSEGNLSNAEQEVLIRKASLLDAKFAAEENFKRLEREARAAQILSGQQLLSQASSTAEKKLANEQILSATSDITRLTPEQVDIRLKALKDSAGFEQQLLKDNLDRAKEENASRKENTAALVEVGNSLKEMHGNLQRIANRDSFIKIEVDNSLNPRIDRLPDNN